MSVSRSVSRSLAAAAAGTALVAGLTALPAQAHAAVQPAAVPACRGALIHIAHTVPEGAMGTSAMVLRFRNISQSTCSLYGYPGLDALRNNGTVLAHAKRVRDGSVGGARRIRTIVLEPNHLASASVQWYNFNPTTGGACAFSAKIAVTPANTSTTTKFPVSVSKCGLQVHPTVAGKGGGIGVH
jgi:hypothetical protein